MGEPVPRPQADNPQTERNGSDQAHAGQNEAAALFECHQDRRLKTRWRAENPAGKLWTRRAPEPRVCCRVRHRCLAEEAVRLPTN